MRMLAHILVAHRCTIFLCIWDDRNINMNNHLVGQLTNILGEGPPRQAGEAPAAQVGDAPPAAQQVHLHVHIYRQQPNRYIYLQNKYCNENARQQ